LRAVSSAASHRLFLRDSRRRQYIVLKNVDILPELPVLEGPLAATPGAGDIAVSSQDITMNNIHVRL
jgi:hypothetical protein